MNINELIQKITDNPEDGALYSLLGDTFFESKNINQAYLCYEYAQHYSTGNVQTEATKKMEACRLAPDFNVHPASFIILSYKIVNIMQECLNAIRNYCIPGSYEVIIVDSSPSDDDVRKWLKEQKDITLVLNDKFGGFSAGCNQGAKLADPDNDIFLLNNDAILTPHAFFYMRLALYSDEKIGAAGPISSNVIFEQRFDNVTRTHDEWMSLSLSLNHPSLNPIQYAHWLQGHALLVKRNVWDYAGMMDENFNFGGHEDVEYGLRLNTLGYKLAICKNAFVYHYGSTSMNTVSAEYGKALDKNRLHLENKFNISYEAISESNLLPCLPIIKEDASMHLNILMIYGGCANTLNLLKYRHPDSTLYTVEQNPACVKIASNYSNAYCIDLEKNKLPFKNEFFDYILFTNLEKCLDLKEILLELKSLMKSNGHLLLIGKNANHVSVIDSLIHGTLNCKLLSNSRQAYTTDDLMGITSSCGFNISRLTWTYSSEFARLSESQQQTLDVILSLPNAKDKNTYLHTGALIDAVIRD